MKKTEKRMRRATPPTDLAAIRPLPQGSDGGQRSHPTDFNEATTVRYIYTNSARGNRSSPVRPPLKTHNKRRMRRITSNYPNADDHCSRVPRERRSAASVTVHWRAPRIPRVPEVRFRQRRICENSVVDRKTSLFRPTDQLALSPLLTPWDICV